MDYKEYYKTYYNYRDAKNKLHKIQNDIAEVINNMLSITAQMKDDVGSSNSHNDKMLSLTAKKIDLEGQEKLAKELLIRMTRQKEEDEEELITNATKSHDTISIIYIKYYIDHIKPKDIASQMAYSLSYIYDVLGQIKQYIHDYNAQKRKKA